MKTPKKQLKDGSVTVVAEASANHGQDLKRAVRLILEAKANGADAVKFQTYTPDTLTIDVDNEYFRVRHAKWKGQTLYQLYKKAYTPWSWFKELKRIADDQGIMFFSTAFDKTAVDFLEEIGVPCHKIASFELVDLPLIEYAAKTGKPLILSTGMATRQEISEALRAARGAGAGEITLLKCVSSYPARPEEMSLKTIPHMSKAFGCPVGLSDHTLGTAVSLAAVTLGARMIEKHFTISRRFRTVDSFFSIEPRELKGLVEGVRVAEKAVGEVRYGLTEDEKKSSVFRRSLFAVRDIAKGDRFSEENIRSIRPAAGMKPKYLKAVIGKRSGRFIKKGTPIKREFISNY